MPRKRKQDDQTPDLFNLEDRLRTAVCVPAIRAEFLAPKIKEFFEHKAFGETVDLTKDDVIRAMSSNIASYVVLNAFEKALRDMIVEEETPELISADRFLSETLPFPSSKKPCESKKTIFNYIPCDNAFETAFAKFLDKSDDVTAFAKLPEQFGFSIHYTDTRANIRNYFPDFIAIASDGTKWVIETKGREDVDVALKDRAAITWCENATELSEANWRYLKVPQKDFESLHPDSLEELIAVLNPPTLFSD